MYKKSLPFLKWNMSRTMSLGRPLFIMDRTQQEQLITQPIKYAKEERIKHYEQVATVFNHWLKVPESKFEQVEEIYHTACPTSVLIDDLQDESPVRYGKPATPRIYSRGLTLNAAIYGLCETLNKTHKLGHPLATKLYLDRIMDLCVSRGLEQYYSDNFICPTEEEYMDIVKGAAIFFVIPVQQLQLFSENKRDHTQLASNFGMYYTILDHYYNLFDYKALQKFTYVTVAESSYEHTFCTDVTEGKFHLPVVHAMRFPDVAGELRDILKQRTTDPRLKVHFVELLRKHGSDAYVRGVLRNLEKDIRAEIEGLGGNPTLSSIMDELVV